jgi:hypothetical protein
MEPAGLEPASGQAVQPCRLPAFWGHVPSTRAPSFPARASPSFQAVHRVGAVTRRPGRRNSRRPRARRDPPRCTQASRNDRCRSHLRLPGWASAVGRDPLEHCCRTEPSKPIRPRCFGSPAGLEPSAVSVRRSECCARGLAVVAERAERAKMMICVGITIAATHELAPRDRPMVGNLRRLTADDADRVEREEPLPATSPARTVAPL